MCFYTANSKRALALAARYGRKTDSIEIVREMIEEQYCIPAYNYPDCAVVTNDEQIQVFKWGLIPHWTKTRADAEKHRKLTINARAETILDLPSYRVPVRTKRCIIPVTGYFEFNHRGKEVIPYFICLKSNELFSIAGIYDEWINPQTSEKTVTFSQITVPANDLTYEIHNGGKNPHRMPAILKRDEETKWLSPALNDQEIRNLLKPFDASAMDAHTVAKDFMKMKSHDPLVIKPVAYNAELSLFE